MAENPIDRFYAAMAKGDIEATRACLTPQARIWHGFDGLAQDVDASAAIWEQLFADTVERGVADVRRQSIEGGFLQRHMFVAKTRAGARMAWPCCLIVQMEGDRIARIDEYMDRAGSFVASDDPVATPGL